MRKVILTIILMLSYISLSYPAEQQTRNIEPKDYIEIHCSLSGGMKQVIFDKYLFTFIEAVEKKTEEHLRSASLDSFVEIQKRTRINKNQEKTLRDWIIKYKISEIAPKPEKDHPGMAELRYSDNLMIYINGKEYNLNHYTINAEPQLAKAFDELFKMAKKFTATAENN